VIGTRSASAYGIKIGEQLAHGIAACGGTVLSLLTKGIDAAAAVGALRAGKPCIAVLGTAHEREHGRLSKDVAAKGALISEYPPGTPTEKKFFRERNRVAAGLSVGVLVIESPEHSGTMTFVEDASEQSKDIFAVPGNIDAKNSVGTNALIQEGAKLVTKAWDVMSEYELLYPDKVFDLSAKVAEDYISDGEKPENDDKNGPKVVDKQNDSDYIGWREKLAGLSEVQLKVVAAIEKPSSHIDDIIEATGLPAMKVAQCITLLKIKGIVRGEDGGRVALKIAEK